MDRETAIEGLAEDAGAATILVVEDNADLRRFVSRSLRTLGYQVLEAADAMAALDLLRRDPAIDLLFTDLRMPGPLSGIDLVEKAKEVRPAIKSLLTSGFSTADVQRNAKSSGAPRVLSKPYRAQDLAKAINEALGGGSDYMR